MEGADLPPLSSADLEALFKLDDHTGAGGYHEVDATAAWLLDPSPANSDPLNGTATHGLSPTGVAGMPADFLMGADPLAGLISSGPSAPLPSGFFPMDALNGSSTAGLGGMLPPLPFGAAYAADSGGAGSGTASGGYAGGGGGVSSMAGVPAASLMAAEAAASGKGGGGKGGGKKQLTEEQKERIKAKNRRAQNRYREKQKAKAADAEASFHQTAAELARLRLENSQLQEQQQAMEKVLTVREHFKSSLEDGKAAAEQEAAAAAEAAQQRPPCGCPSRAQCTCLQQPDASDASSGAKQAAARMALCQAGGPAQHADLAASGGPCCPLTGLSLSQIAELKQTPPEALQRDWRNISRRLAATLQQLEAARESHDATLSVQAEQLEGQMEETLREGQSFCFEHAVYQPTNVQKLFAAALDDGLSSVSVDDMAHWEGVASALQLSEQQLQRLETARTAFLRRIADVCAERRAILARLQALGEEDLAAPTSLRAMQHMTAAWLKVHETTADLTANMNEEHCVCMTFVRDAFGWVLTPYQKAVAIVRAYPFFPDMFSVTTAALKAPQPALLAGAGPGGGAALLVAPDGSGTTASGGSTSIVEGSSGGGGSSGSAPSGAP